MEGFAGGFQLVSSHQRPSTDLKPKKVSQVLLVFFPPGLPAGFPRGVQLQPADLADVPVSTFWFRFSTSISLEVDVPFPFSTILFKNRIRFFWV